MIPIKTNVSEFPRYPPPQVPPPQVERPHVQPPTVFVYEKQGWEYKVISKDAAADAGVTEGELNALGQDGWELVGVFQTSGGLQFYLKRTIA